MFNLDLRCEWIRGLETLKRKDNKTSVKSQSATQDKSLSWVQRPRAPTGCWSVSVTHCSSFFTVLSQITGVPNKYTLYCPESHLHQQWHSWTGKKLQIKKSIHYHYPPQDFSNIISIAHPKHMTLGISSINLSQYFEDVHFCMDVLRHIHALQEQASPLGQKNISIYLSLNWLRPLTAWQQLDLFCRETRGMTTIK